MKNKKYIGIGIISLFLLFVLSGIAVAQTTVVSVSPSTQNVAKGETFTIDITIDPGVSIAGAQFDLSFNPSLVSANSVTEGILLKRGGASTYFSSGVIDNTAGTITGVAGAITTPGQTVSSPGVFATIQMTAKSVDGTSALELSNVIVGDINGNPVSITVNDGSVTVGEVGYFDTGSGTYPSIFGTHTGTIKPNRTINVSKMFTYSCSGTGGHSEYVVFSNAATSVEIANGTWNGYQGAGDHHYIIFEKSFMLEKDVTYNYTIRTGSYPQIHHTPALQTANGWINCTKFTDANGKEYTDWIPAIRLE